MPTVYITYFAFKHFIFRIPQIYLLQVMQGLKTVREEKMWKYIWFSLAFYQSFWQNIVETHSNKNGWNKIVFLSTLGNGSTVVLFGSTWQNH